jgi:hypothetical protein
LEARASKEVSTKTSMKTEVITISIPARNFMLEGDVISKKKKRRKRILFTQKANIQKEKKMTTITTHQGVAFMKREGPSEKIG